MTATARMVSILKKNILAYMNHHFYKVYQDITLLFYEILNREYDIQVIGLDEDEKQRHISVIDFLELVKHNVVSNFLSKCKLYELIIRSNDSRYISSAAPCALEKFSFYFFHKNFSSSSREASILQRLLLISLYFMKRKKGGSTRNNDMVIYWIPTRIKRDFNFKYPIEKKILNIETSKTNFGAFSTSGLNFTLKKDTNDSQYISSNAPCALDSQYISSNARGVLDSLNNKSNNKDVSIITRLEEVEKLLIHELIHNIKLDKRDIINREMYSRFNQMKKKNYFGSEIMLVEVFTEWACTLYFLVFFIFFENNFWRNRNLNLNFLGAPHKKDNLGFAEFRQRFKRLHEQEVKYSIDTVFFLLDLNGYRDVKTFNKEKYFYGRYPFYEYYYMKTMAMLHCRYSEDLKVYKDIINLCETDFPVGKVSETLAGKFENYYKFLRTQSHKKINYRFLKNKFV
jgi:hypothetical protein